MSKIIEIRDYPDDHEDGDWVAPVVCEEEAAWWQGQLEMLFDLENEELDQGEIGLDRGCCSYSEPANRTSCRDCFFQGTDDCPDY